MGERELGVGYIQRWVRESLGWGIYSDGRERAKGGVYTATGERELKVGYIQRWVRES